jgi:two-component system, LytTR family, response regulator
MLIHSSSAVTSCAPTVVNPQNFVTNQFVMINVNLSMESVTDTAVSFPEFPGMSQEIRTVIADNDQAARNQLLGLLHSEAGVRVVAECEDKTTTLAAVRIHKPDLLILDARLSDTDGVDVLRSISKQDSPLVIFSSNQDQYAIRAFEARAIDYLLKPFDPEHLHAALERTRAELARTQGHHLTRRLLDLLAGTQPQSKSDKRLAVKAGGRVVFLDKDEIDWIEAEGNYVRLKAGTESYMIREAIGRIAQKLDPDQFVRIHRSIIVNVRKIKELHPCNRGEYMVILKDGKELSCSRGYRAKLQQLIASF